MADERLSKLAKLLVNYSTGIKKDDIVFICADEVATSWVIEVAKEAIKLGAHVEYRLESEEVSEVKLKYANEEQLKQGNLIYETLLQKADVWLTAWGGRNTRSLSKVDPQKIKLSQQGSSKWKSIYSQRCGDGVELNILHILMHKKQV